MKRLLILGALLLGALTIAPQAKAEYCPYGGGGGYGYGGGYGRSYGGAYYSRSYYRPHRAYYGHHHPRRVHYGHRPYYRGHYYYSQPSFSFGIRF